MSLIVLQEDDFNKGSFEGVYLDNGIIMLEKDKTQGYFQSESISCDKFKEAVVSWNGNTVESSYISLQLSLFVDGKWSMWFSYGKWSTDGNNIGSVSKQVDDLGKINVDVISVIGESSKFKIKAILERNNIEIKSPTLRRVSVSTFYEYSEINNIEIKDIDIEVPMISQMLIHEIGKKICSPTSLSMIMGNYGYVEDPFSIAQSCFDNFAGIYGNWAYNIAYSGECGLNSSVVLCENAKVISDYIKSGIPLVASIKTKDIDQLKGAPQTYPSGHLLVVRGFANKDKTYIIVNDPASKETENVKRYYEFSEFVKVWNKIIYVIKPEK